MDLFYVILSIVIIAIALLLWRFISRWNKKQRLFRDERRKVLLKKKEIVDFLALNENEFYPPEIIIRMDKLRELGKEIEEIMINFKKNFKTELRKVKEKLYQELDQEKGFDLLGVKQFESEMSVNWEIKASVLLAKIDFQILQTKATIGFASLLLGGVKSEIKKRPDFLHKCHEYLRAELVFCNFLKSSEKRNFGYLFGDLSSVLFGVRFFLSAVEIEDLKDLYEPLFAKFQSSK